MIDVWKRRFVAPPEAVLRAAAEAVELWGGTLGRAGEGPGEAGVAALPEPRAEAPDEDDEAAVAGERRWGDPSAVRPLALPVQAGLRRGVLRGQLRVVAAAATAARAPAEGEKAEEQDADEQDAGARSELRLEIADGDYRLHGSAVAILALAAGAGLAIVLWPWFPHLLQLLPIALVLAAAAWFLVLSRLQNRGVDELFDTVDELLARDEPTAVS